MCPVFSFIFSGIGVPLLIIFACLLLDVALNNKLCTVNNIIVIGKR